MTDVNVLVPGARDVRGTLEVPADADGRAIVVACPPHPRHGGNRSDRRLAAVSDALVDREVACLRFDYGEWDEGYGELEDVRNAIRWASDHDRYDRVGLFGYSFGATLALLASADFEGDGGDEGDPAPAVTATAALAPTARLADDLDAVAALESFADVHPTAILYGTRDTTVEWEPLVDRARELGSPVETVELAGDHFFVGQHDRIADRAGSFLEDHLR